MRHGFPICLDQNEYGSLFRDTLAALVRASGPGLTPDIRFIDLYITL
jgi:hypothetical protein